MRLWRSRSPKPVALPTDPSGVVPHPADKPASTRDARSIRVALTAADRCDRCGAQAYVLLAVFVPASGERELYLCAHDYRHHEPHLVRAGVRVLLDQRRMLHGGTSYA